MNLHSILHIPEDIVLWVSPEGYHRNCRRPQEAPRNHHACTADNAAIYCECPCRTESSRYWVHYLIQRNPTPASWDRYQCRRCNEMNCPRPPYEST